MSKMDPFFSTTYKLYISLYRRVHSFNLYIFLSNLWSDVDRMIKGTNPTSGSQNAQRIRHIFNEKTHTIDIENIDQNIIILNQHFLLLASLLSLITEASYELKVVINEVHKELPYYIENGRIIFYDDKIEKCLDIAKSRMLSAIDMVANCFDQVPFYEGTNAENSHEDIGLNESFGTAGELSPPRFRSSSLNMSLSRHKEEARHVFNHPFSPRTPLRHRTSFTAGAGLLSSKSARFNSSESFLLRSFHHLTSKISAIFDGFRTHSGASWSGNVEKGHGDNSVVDNELNCKRLNRQASINEDTDVTISQALLKLHIIAQKYRYSVNHVSEDQPPGTIKPHDNSSYFYPLNTIKPDFRRPTYYERYWLYHLVLTLGSIYTFKTVCNMLEDGSLQRLVWQSYVQLSRTIVERVVEPVKDLCSELFQTISRRQDGMVTEADLEASQKALNRMLEDFLKQQPSEQQRAIMADSPCLVNFHRSTLTSTAVAREAITSDLPSNGADAGDSSTGSFLARQLSSLSHSASAAASRVYQTALTAAGYDNSKLELQLQLQQKLQLQQALRLQEKASSDKIMEVLMTQYEQDMKKPITGLVFGNLMTTMLIQMQKLKVHTESALLTMDQVLASNQLTMAGTAAMPALLFFGLLGFGAYKYLIPSPPKPGKMTRAIRLAMSDVERSLSDAYGSGVSMSCRICNPPTVAGKSSVGIASASTREVNPKYKQSSQFTSSSIPGLNAPTFQPVADDNDMGMSLSKRSYVAASPVSHSHNAFAISDSISKFDETTDDNFTLKSSNQNDNVFLRVPSTEPFNITNPDVLAPASSFNQHGVRSKLGVQTIMEEYSQSTPYPSTAAGDDHDVIDLDSIKRIQTRGILQYHLCQLRVELHKLFFNHRFSRHSLIWFFTPNISVLSMGRSILNILRYAFPVTFSVPYHTSWHTHVSQTLSGPIKSSIATTHLLPSSYIAHSSHGWWSMRTIINGNEGLMNSEYHSISRDLKILIAPDFEQCGCRKKDAAHRMRLSYQCFVPPVS